VGGLQQQQGRSAERGVEDGARRIQVRAWRMGAGVPARKPDKQEAVPAPRRYGWQGKGEGSIGSAQGGGCRRTAPKRPPRCRKPTRRKADWRQERTMLLQARRARPEAAVENRRIRAERPRGLRKHRTRSVSGEATKPHNPLPLLVERKGAESSGCPRSWEGDWNPLQPCMKKGKHLRDVCERGRLCALLLRNGWVGP